MGVLVWSRWMAEDDLQNPVQMQASASISKHQQQPWGAGEGPRKGGSDVTLALRRSISGKWVSELLSLLQRAAQAAKQQPKGARSVGFRRGRVPRTWNGICTPAKPISIYLPWPVVYTSLERRVENKYLYSRQYASTVPCNTQYIVYLHSLFIHLFIYLLIHLPT